MNLLMTRPQAAAERFVAQLPADLRARLTPVYSPLVAIEPSAAEITFGDARGLIFTSSNGVAVAADLTDRRDLPCFCVGEATTRAANAAGWQAICAGTDAEGLIATLHHSPPKGPLLHLRGKHGRGNVAARLSTLKCPTQEQTIYDQPLLPLSKTAQGILQGFAPVIVPLFSPRTARQFAKLVTGPAPLYIAALSESVASPLKTMNYKELAISAHPNAKAMMLVVDLLTKNAVRVEGDKPAQ